MPGLNGTSRRSPSHRDRTASRRKRFLANGNRHDTSRRHPYSSAYLDNTPPLRMLQQHFLPRSARFGGIVSLVLHAESSIGVWSERGCAQTTASQAA